MTCETILNIYNVIGKQTLVKEGRKMKKTFDRPGSPFLYLLILVLVFMLVPFSCLGEAAPALEATPEQIYAEALWADGYDDDFWSNVFDEDFWASGLDDDYWSYDYDDDSWSSGFDEDYEYTEEKKTIMRLVDLLVYNNKIADWCKEEAAKLPEDSKTRRKYEEFEKLLREMQPGRPTEKESKAYSDRALNNISTQLKEEAVEYYKRCVEAEPKITADLCDIADELGTELFGIKYRLKSAGDNAKGVCRIADKIDGNMKIAEKAGNPISYQEAAESVHDIVRYTMASTPKTLVQNYLETKEKLEAKGYRFVKVKNTWETYSLNAPYRGVNTKIESPYGIIFEMQFHTAESFVIKEVTHEIYETTRDPRVSKEEKASLLKQAFEMFDRMTAPDRISEIVPVV